MIITIIIRITTLIIILRRLHTTITKHMNHNNNININKYNNNCNDNINYNNKY